MAIQREKVVTVLKSKMDIRLVTILDSLGKDYRSVYDEALGITKKLYFKNNMQVPYTEEIEEQLEKNKKYQRVKNMTLGLTGTETILQDRKVSDFALPCIDEIRKEIKHFNGEMFNWRRKKERIEANGGTIKEPKPAFPSKPIADKIRIRLSKDIISQQKQEDSLKLRIFNLDLITVKDDMENIDLQWIYVDYHEKYYTFTLIYLKSNSMNEILSLKPCDREAAIDLGVVKFVTVVTTVPFDRQLQIDGAELKEMNKEYNRKAHELLSVNNYKQLDGLNKKVKEQFDIKFKQIAEIVVKYLIERNIKKLYIGTNKTLLLKEITLSNGYKIRQLNFGRFIEILRVMAVEFDIDVEIVNEKFTSGTSFIDNENISFKNYDINRRENRDNFVTNNNQVVDSDINAAFQILRVGNNAFHYNTGIEFKNPILLRA